MDKKSSAPFYQVPKTKVISIEHPMIIKNLENGLKTLGKGKPFGRILKAKDSLPLFLRPNDQMCTPILSYNSPTSNVLLKITVPKPTRKRKRGSQDPYTDIVSSSVPEQIGIGKDTLCSHSRNDEPAQLLRSLKDNTERYQIEAVAEIQRTHRFRGFSDFHHSTAHSEFSTKLHDFVLPGDVAKLRQFKFDPDRGWKKNEQFMPPPTMTNESMPFNWAYQQNVHLITSVNEKTGEKVLINKSKAPKIPLQYLPQDIATVPTKSSLPLPKDEGLLLMIRKVSEALEERPIWTRRALGNRIGHEKLPYPISRVLHHLAFQFRGGPFRDTIIKFGVDPRTDVKYRKYQTLYFQLYEGERGKAKEWKDFRNAIPLSTNKIREDLSTHIFDGKTLALDGKLWQLCDITEPILKKVIDEAPVRDYSNNTTGYYCNGTWAKLQTIMKTMLIAIRARVPMNTLNFDLAIKAPDVVENNNKAYRGLNVPVPQIVLSEEEVQELVDTGLDVNFLASTGSTASKQKRARRITQAKPTRKYVFNAKSRAANGKVKIIDGSKKTPQGVVRTEEPEVQADGEIGSREDSHGLEGSDNVLPTIENDGLRGEEEMEDGDDEDAVEGGNSEEEIGDGDEGEEREMDDENEDEESEHGDSDREDGGMADEEDEFDSDTTDDIVDPATAFTPSRPRSNT